jgi:ribosomal protein L37AE/L43A
MFDLDLAHCADCGELYNKARQALGYYTCKDCGEAHAQAQRARWTVAPLNKSNYILVTDTEELKQLNPKRTI